MTATQTLDPTPIRYLSEGMHRRLLGYPRLSIPPSKLKQAEAKWEKYYVPDPEDEGKLKPLHKALKDKLEPIDIALPADLPTAIECIDLLHSELRIDRVISRLDAFAACDIPEIPENIPTQPGWWLYEAGKWQSGGYPQAVTAVFDFETVDIDGKWYPVCCSAVSSTKWWVWIWDQAAPKEVIDWGTNSLLIGHNVTYDRSFLANEYQYQPTGSLFPCTLSMWVATHGFADQQKGLVRSDRDELDFVPDWLSETGKAGLADVYEFYYQEKLDKGVVHELLEGGGLGWINTSGNFERLLAYNLADVQATHKIFKKLWPEYRHAYHCVEVPKMGEVMIYSDLLHGKSWLPMSASRFPTWYTENENRYQEIKGKISEELRTLAEKILESRVAQALTCEAPYCPLDATPYEKQLISLDWVASGSKTRTEKKVKYKVHIRGWELVGKDTQLPYWFKKVFSGDKELTLKSRVTPLIIGCKWLGSPVVWDDGWYTSEGSALPHPDGKGQKVHDLFMKGMATPIRTGVLTSELDTAEIMKLLSQTILWTSFRKRFSSIRTQQVSIGTNTYPVWITHNTRYPGTISFRLSGDSQVLPNKKEEDKDGKPCYSDKLGCSIKSLVEAPEGSLIAGGDADSQELKFTAMLGDVVLGFHGSQAGSLMTLLGNKKDKTTLHWVLALKAAIEYGLAKNCIYGAIYGLGVPGLSDYFLKANPTMPKSEAVALAEETLNLLKGIMDYGIFSGGLLSDSFNVLRKKAKADVMSSLICGRKISKALRHLGKDFMTTRVNWLVQSAGSDQRGLVVVFMHWLLKRYTIDARLITPIHDEFRYCVSEDHLEEFNWAFQLSHLLMQAITVERLGLDGITCSHAYFPEVDFDKVLRKDVKDPMESICNPVAISPGYILKPKALEGFIPHFLR